MSADQEVAGSHKPYFLITIDTEEDNAWARAQDISTQNARFLPRFQELCERFNLKPSYLVNYPMASSPEFVEFGNDVLARNQGEIGMHLHGWNTPPDSPLTDRDYRSHPYLIEFPETVMREKVRIMTDILESKFARKMTSHRAGRWAMNEAYCKLLVEHGYRVDCSVTPHVDWADTMGHPQGDGGTDYRRYPEYPYYIDLDDMALAGASPLIELPVTIVRHTVPLLDPVRTRLSRRSIVRRAINRALPETSWLRPNTRGVRQMLNVVDTVIGERRAYAQFMLHSSEFMPGGSPVFPTERSIEQMFDTLTQLFEYVMPRFTSATLAEFGDAFERDHA